MLSVCGGTRGSPHGKLRAVRRITCYLLSAVCCLSLHAQTLHLSGFVSGAAASTNGPKPWLDGGFGRLEGSFAQAQLGADWTPSNWFDVHVHGIARHDSDLDHAGVA